MKKLFFYLGIFIIFVEIHAFVALNLLIEEWKIEISSLLRDGYMVFSFIYNIIIFLFCVFLAFKNVKEITDKRIEYFSKLLIFYVLSIIMIFSQF